MIKANTSYFLFALICAFSVANIYYNQPLLGLFAQQLHLSPQQIGSLPLLIQISYALGLIFFVPLGDFLSRRKILVTLLLINGIASCFVAFSQTLIQLLICNVFIGMTAVGAQIIIPMVSLIVSGQQKGQAIGLVMSGLMTGVLLGRILSGYIGELYGWQLVYRFAVVVDLLLIFIVYKIVPQHLTQQAHLSYPQILKSLSSQFIAFKELRIFCLSGGLIFAAVSSVWGALAFLLAQQPFHYASDFVGSLGFTGIAGILATPYIGQLTDKFQPKIIIIFSSLFCIVGFVCIGLSSFSIFYLIVGLIILDIGARASLLGNQLRTFGLSEHARSRLNTVFMFCYFLGGAVGTWLGALVSYTYSWHGMCAVGILLGCANLLINYRLNSTQTADQI